MSVTTNYPLVVAKLGQLVPALRAAAATGMRRGLEAVRTVSQTKFLSGPRPQVLDVVTTRLRNSLSIEVKSDSEAITGRIGSNVAYAARHEFGFSGTEQVPAHTRVTAVHFKKGRVTGRELMMMRGPIQDRQGKVVGFKRSLKAVASRMKSGFAEVAFVQAHIRNVNYAGKPFVRPALEQERGVVVEQVEQSIKRAVAAAGNKA